MMDKLKIQRCFTSDSILNSKFFCILGILIFGFNDIHAMQQAEHPIRSLRIDLDHIYDTDSVQMDQNISSLVNRIGQYRLSAVFLQGYVDDDALGYARQLYFLNRHLPMKADLLKKVVLRIRASHPHVQIYAWMPIIAFDLGNDSLLIKSINPQTGQTFVDPDKYKRLCFFNPKVRRIIFEIYEDIASQVPIDGIAFHDDGVMTDFEDASDDAIQAQTKAGFPSSILDIRKNHPLFIKWTRWKIEALTQFTLDIMDVVKQYIPLAKSTRSLFALPILNPDSEEWFAQNYDNFLKSYDFTALMAMPYMENADNPKEWMNTIINVVKKHPMGLSKTLFELQSVDWRLNTPIPPQELVEQMQNLEKNGAIHYGYYPDDLFNNHPDSHIVTKGLSIGDIK